MVSPSNNLDKLLALCAAEDEGRACGILADVSFTLGEKFTLLQQNSLESSVRSIGDFSQHVEKASFILLLLSSKSKADSLLVSLFELCHRLNKRIVPVWMEDTKMDWDLPLRSAICCYPNPIGRSDMMKQIKSLMGYVPQMDDKLVFSVGGASIEMVKVKGGTFFMGAHHNLVTKKFLFSTKYEPDESEPNYDYLANDDEEPVHTVSLSDFYMDKFAVTQAVWEVVMGTNPSHNVGNDYPIECVSRNDCNMFLDRLNVLLYPWLQNKKFRLPTEAEWEFAARGGTFHDPWRFSGDNTVFNSVWFSQNAKSTMPVGMKTPNSLGIFDMSGNVWELCQDVYGPYDKTNQINPVCVMNGNSCVRRGGAFNTDSKYCRVSARGKIGIGQRFSNTGFRLVLSEEK